MRKWVILAAVLVLVVAIVGVAAVNLNGYLNRNKEWLAAQAAAGLGREVGFEEIGVSIAGGFGVRITDLRIADDPAFSREPFIQAAGVHVSVRLLPALLGRIEVGRFLLERPLVTIIRTAKGTNVETVGTTAAGRPDKTPQDGPPPETQRPPGQPARSGTPQGDADDGSAPPPQTLPLLIAAVDIEDGELRYIDRTATTPGAGELVIRHLDFSATDVGLTTPVRLDIAAALFGAEKHNFSAEGTVGPLGEPVDAARAPIDLSVSLAPLDVDAARRALPAVATQIPPPLTIGGMLEIRARVTGTLGAPGLSDVRFGGGDAAIAYGETFTKPRGLPLELALDTRRGADVLSVEALALRLAALELTASGSVGTATPAAVDLTFEVRRTSLDGWDRIFPALAGYELSGNAEAALKAKGTVGGPALPRLTGTVTLSDLGVRGEGLPALEDFSPILELTGDGVVLPATPCRLGGSPVEVAATVEGFGAPVVRFTLRSPELRAASLGLAGDTDGDDTLKGLVVEGTLRLGGAAPEFRGSVRSAAGRVQLLDYQDLAVDARLQGGIATLEALSLRVYEGTHTGTGRYDMRDANRPAFAFQSTLEGVRLDGLLGPRFPGAAETIDGRLHADLSLAGTGVDWETIRTTLTGSGRAEVREGALEGVNIAEAVLGGITSVGGLSTLVPANVRGRHPELFTAKRTAFDRCGGSVRVADGRVATDDLTLAAEDYEIRGRGWFSFDSNVDFTAVLVGSERLSRDIVDEVSAAKYLANQTGRLEIPFRFAGPLASAKPQPDMTVVARALKGALIGEGLDRLLGGRAREQRPAADGAWPGARRRDETTGVPGAQGGQGAGVQQEQQKQQAGQDAPGQQVEQGTQGKPGKPGKQGKKARQGKKQPTEEPTTEDVLQRGLEQLLGQ